ncbi:hypothetical protein MD484_g6709, partial [Candolleomyces efflorescens]
MDVLEDKATVYARTTFANYTLSVAIAGIHIFMAVYGLWIFLETPEHLRKGRKRYIIASLIITSLWVTGAALDISHYFQLLLRSTSSYELLVLMSRTQNTWSPMLSLVCLGGVLLVADGLLVYRCFMICIQYWWIVIVPAAASLSGIVLFFVTNVFLRLNLSTAGLGWRLYSASASLLAASNILLTGLIAFRLIQERRTLSGLLPSADTGPYTAVITLLIESALPLSIFGISLSPHMIIFRVTTGRSFAKFPFARDGSISKSLRSPHEPAESTFLHSTLNLEAGKNLDVERGSGGDGSEAEKGDGKEGYIEKAY